MKISATIILSGLIFILISCGQNTAQKSDTYGQWMKKPQDQWPQITMINRIDYVDKQYPVAGCGFLLDIGDDTLAATAKHILTFFKSDSMNAISFNNSLRQWTMFPKNNPDDSVIIGKMINENPQESLTNIAPARDWLLFTLKDESPNIQPLRFRETPLQEGEPVYIIGWRYSDKECPQVIYEGNFVRAEEGSFLITTKELTNNTMPGLSGSPVIDANGYLLGLMSQKAGEMERPASIDYPKQIIDKWKTEKD